MGIPSISIVDLSPFFNENDEVGKRKAMDIITKACTDCGFFQIVNHGVPLVLMRRALNLSQTFFESSDEEKLKLTIKSTTILPAGYTRPPEDLLDKNEYLVMFSPRSGANIYPTNPPEFQEVAEEMFTHMSKVGLLMERIINECLGLPPSFLNEYNQDGKWDFMAALRYFPATDTNNIGLTEHGDGNCVTFVFQDDTGGLEVRKNGEWIPITPEEGAIVVNCGDIIQVLSNDKFKSPTHRVVRPVGRSRYSYGFFRTPNGENWVEPLPEFTREKGEAPKYKGFFYKDYQKLRMRNKTQPSSNPEDVTHIAHFAISTQLKEQVLYL